ncbi:MAG: glutathione ABC transporter ATP-binding protein [Deltaproteobacteria bacterium SG8_13]|nr:MAG: glutathione ABC transporter ATP-binding protein [Deltaproteobacteria bacterium SG8_13]
MKKTPDKNPDPVLDVRHLTIAYETRKGEVEAVRDVSFGVREGQTVGLVGESGCGKSTIAFGIVNFLGPNGRINSGKVIFQGNDLVGRLENELKKLRGDRISMVYQDPMQALNPAVRLGDQLVEVLTFHKDISAANAWDRCVEMLRRVYMPDPQDVMRRFTHQISGGQQQRVVIAMAMLNNPALLIMDEPTTALDVTVEAAVLDLLEDLKNEYQTANIFITHNLGVVARVSDYLCVMYAGELVERGDIREIFERPCHPYTMGLLSCVPKLGDSKLDSNLHPIRGRVPPPAKRPKDECIFAPRCNYATDQCRQGRPALLEVGGDHLARCIYAGEIDSRPRTRRSQRRARQVEALAQSIKPAEPLLGFDQLKVYYPQQSNSLVSLIGLGEKKFVKAVDDVSLRLAKGRTLGVVGESGCGKSTLVKGIIGLEQVTEGQIEFLGIDVTQPVSGRDASLIREMQMVFQNPDSTLNPSYSIGKQIARPIRKFKTVPKKRVKEEVIRLLKAVRLSATYYDRLPRQLSGGEKQRVGIARALASRPDLIICDEPVSALDVSVQAAVINLLLDIQQSFGSSMIFIAHDLSVVRFFSDDIAVMYLGQIVELGPAEAIYDPPYHPYTEALLSAVPIPDPDAEQTEIRLNGNVPSALDPPSGCRFHTRCPRRKEMLADGGLICEQQVPPWQSNGRGHRILCHIPIEMLKTIDPVVHANGDGSSLQPVE